jgi:hypothetical protein
MTDIDRTLDALAHQQVDADLTLVEAEVWAQIDADRAGALVLADGTAGWVQALRPHALAIAGALLIGAMIGAASLPPEQTRGPLAAFSSTSPLAPSTLLGDGKG